MFSLSETNQTHYTVDRMWHRWMKSLHLIATMPSPCMLHDACYDAKDCIKGTRKGRVQQKINAVS